MSFRDIGYALCQHNPVLDDVHTLQVTEDRHEGAKTMSMLNLSKNLKKGHCSRSPDTEILKDP